MRIGIDIGGSHIAAGLVNDNKIIYKKEIDIKIGNEKNPKKTLENHIRKLVQDLIEINNNKNQIELIGIAVPRKCEK